MCISDTATDNAYQTFQRELVAAGLLIPSGVAGVYGRSGVFEHIVARLEDYITRMGAHQNPEVVRFPPVMSRAHYLCTDHIANFPDLMGSVHSFMGNDKAHLALLQKREQGEEWSGDLNATEVVLAPAACYALYPTAQGTLPAQGRIVDLTSYVFRHEPSQDPARMQSFRMREYVRLGTPEQALNHRDYWLDRGQEMLRALGLNVERVVANDPFFGRGGKVMAVSQREQAMKYELVVPVANPAKPTAVFSANYHRDHFAHTFGIHLASGECAHTACVGFGLERITLALLKTHGFVPAQWPAEVKQVLAL